MPALKIINFFLTGLLVFFCSSIHLLAGALDNNNNHSAEYARMGARQASVDSLDSVVYNPAGTPRIADGFYTAIHDQIIVYDMGHEYNDNEYKAEGASYLYPGLYCLYVSGDFSYYLGYTIAGGIGEVEYKDGTYLTEAAGALNRDIEASSAYHSVIAGAAAALTSDLSISIGVRGIYSYYEVKAGPDAVLLDYRDSAIGAAPVFGADITPSDKLNIGIRYEAEVNLEFNVDKNERAGLASSLYPEEDSKFRRDLPAMLCTGVTYLMLDKKLKLALDIDCAFNKNARWTENLRNGEDEDKYSNSLEFRAGAEFAFTDALKVSAGFHRGDPGADSDSYPILGPKMPFYGISCGGMIKPFDDIVINAGVSRFFYEDVENNQGIKIFKEILLIALGVQARLY